MTGSVNGTLTTYAQLHTAFCANMTAVIDCNQVSINIAPATSLTTLNAQNPTLTYSGGAVTNAWGTDVGNSGSLMVFQTIYQLSVFKAPFLALATQSSGTFLAVATAVYVNE